MAPREGATKGANTGRWSAAGREEGEGGEEKTKGGKGGSEMECGMARREGREI